MDKRAERGFRITMLFAGIVMIAYIIFWRFFVRDAALFPFNMDAWIVSFIMVPACFCVIAAVTKINLKSHRALLLGLAGGVIISILTSRAAGALVWQKLAAVISGTAIMGYIDTKWLAKKER